MGLIELFLECRRRERRELKGGREGVFAEGFGAPRTSHVLDRGSNRAAKLPRELRTILHKSRDTPSNLGEDSGIATNVRCVLRSHRRDVEEAASKNALDIFSPFSRTSSRHRVSWNLFQERRRGISNFATAYELAGHVSSESHPRFATRINSTITAICFLSRLPSSIVL